MNLINFVSGFLIYLCVVRAQQQSFNEDPSSHISVDEQRGSVLPVSDSNKAAVRSKRQNGEDNEDHDHHHHHGNPLDWLRDSVAGEPGVDYPIFAKVPDTSFSCDNRIDGLYADIEARCQPWHTCFDGRIWSFLCPNGTIFDQTIFTCVWWFNFDCSTAEQFYSLNEGIYIDRVDQGPNRDQVTNPSSILKSRPANPNTGAQSSQTLSQFGRPQPRRPVQTASQTSRPSRPNVSTSQSRPLPTSQTSQPRPSATPQKSRPSPFPTRQRPSQPRPSRPAQATSQPSQPIQRPAPVPQTRPRPSQSRPSVSPASRPKQLSPGSKSLIGRPSPTPQTSRPGSFQSGPQSRPSQRPQVSPSRPSSGIKVSSPSSRPTPQPSGLRPLQPTSQASRPFQSISQPSGASRPAINTPRPSQRTPQTSRPLRPAIQTSRPSRPTPQVSKTLRPTSQASEPSQPTSQQSRPIQPRPQTVRPSRPSSQTSRPSVKPSQPTSQTSRPSQPSSQTLRPSRPTSGSRFIQSTTQAARPRPSQPTRTLSGSRPRPSQSISSTTRPRPSQSISTTTRPRPSRPTLSTQKTFQNTFNPSQSPKPTPQSLRPRPTPGSRPRPSQQPSQTFRPQPSTSKPVTNSPTSFTSASFDDLPTYKKSTPRPATNRPRPSTNRPRPSTNRPRPSTNRPRPSTNRPRPSTNRPRPSTNRPRPSTNRPRPSTNRPRPSTNRPRPSTNRPRPSTSVSPNTRRPSNRPKSGSNTLSQSQPNPSIHSKGNRRPITSSVNQVTNSISTSFGGFSTTTRKQETFPSSTVTTVKVTQVPLTRRPTGSQQIFSSSKSQTFSTTSFGTDEDALPTYGASKSKNNAKLNDQKSRLSSQSIKFGSTNNQNQRLSQTLQKTNQKFSNTNEKFHQSISSSNGIAKESTKQRVQGAFISGSSSNNNNDQDILNQSSQSGSLKTIHSTSSLTPNIRDKETRGQGQQNRFKSSFSQTQNRGSNYNQNTGLKKAHSTQQFGTHSTNLNTQKFESSSNEKKGGQNIQSQANQKSNNANNFQTTQAQSQRVNHPSGPNIGFNKHKDSTVRGQTKGSSSAINSSHQSSSFQSSGSSGQTQQVSSITGKTNGENTLSGKFRGQGNSFQTSSNKKNTQNEAHLFNQKGNGNGPHSGSHNQQTHQTSFQFLQFNSNNKNLGNNNSEKKSQNFGGQSAQTIETQSSKTGTKTALNIGGQRSEQSHQQNKFQTSTVQGHSGGTSTNRNHAGSQGNTQSAFQSSKSVIQQGSQGFAPGNGQITLNQNDIQSFTSHNQNRGSSSQGGHQTLFQSSKSKNVNDQSSFTSQSGKKEIPSTNRGEQFQSASNNGENQNNGIRNGQTSSVVSGQNFVSSQNKVHGNRHDQRNQQNQPSAFSTRNQGAANVHTRGQGIHSTDRFQHSRFQSGISDGKKISNSQNRVHGTGSSHINQQNRFQSQAQENTVQGVRNNGQRVQQSSFQTVKFNNENGKNFVNEKSTHRQSGHIKGSGSSSLETRGQGQNNNGGINISNQNNQQSYNENIKNTRTRQQSFSTQAQQDRIKGQENKINGANQFSHQASRFKQNNNSGARGESQQSTQTFSGNRSSNKGNSNQNGRKTAHRFVKTNERQGSDISGSGVRGSQIGTQNKKDIRFEGGEREQYGQNVQQSSFNRQQTSFGQKERENANRGQSNSSFKKNQSAQGSGFQSVSSQSTTFHNLGGSVTTFGSSVLHNTGQRGNSQGVRQRGSSETKNSEDSSFDFTTEIQGNRFQQNRQNTQKAGSQANHRGGSFKTGNRGNNDGSKTQGSFQSTSYSSQTQQTDSQGSSFLGPQSLSSILKQESIREQNLDKENHQNTLSSSSHSQTIESGGSSSSENKNTLGRKRVPINKQSTNRRRNRVKAGQSGIGNSATSNTQFLEFGKRIKIKSSQKHGGRKITGSRRNRPIPTPIRRIPVRQFKGQNKKFQNNFRQSTFKTSSDKGSNSEESLLTFFSESVPSAGERNQSPFDNGNNKNTQSSFKQINTFSSVSNDLPILTLESTEEYTSENGKSTVTKSQSSSQLSKPAPSSYLGPQSIITFSKEGEGDFGEDFISNLADFSSTQHSTLSFSKETPAPIAFRPINSGSTSRPVTNRPSNRKPGFSSTTKRPNSLKTSFSQSQSFEVKSKGNEGQISPSIFHQNGIETSTVSSSSFSSSSSYSSSSSSSSSPSGRPFRPTASSSILASESAQKEEGYSYPEPPKDKQLTLRPKPPKKVQEPKQEEGYAYPVPPLDQQLLLIVPNKPSSDLSPAAQTQIESEVPLPIYGAPASA